MKKFSKIYETKEKILDIIGVSESDIKEICNDLIDEYDYSFKITPQYISSSGNIYYKPDQASEYFPSILVELNRQVSDRQTGKSIAKYDDVRNWNGGVYYDGDAKLIKTIYETVQRIESMLEDGDIKVYYAMRSLNEINLRITTGTEKTSLPINIEEVKDFIENDIEDLELGDYQVKKTWSQGSERTVEIKPKDGVFHTDVQKFDDNPRDNILRRIIDTHTGHENWQEVIKYTNQVVKSIFEVCSKKSKDIKVGYFESDYLYKSGITREVYIWNDQYAFRDQRLIKFSLSVDEFSTGNVRLVKGGIFKNDKIIAVKIYNTALKITILVEKGYGD